MVSLPFKTALLALAMILIQDASLAQQNAHISGPSENQIDSVLHRFSIETSDQLRMGMARELGLYFRESNPDTAIYYLDKQLQLARSLGERLWEGDALRRLGYLAYTQEKYSESFTLNSEALKLFTDVSTERQVWEPGRLSVAGTPQEARLTELSLCHFQRGQLYGRISNAAQQRALFRKAIEIIEKVGDDAIASFMYSNLGGTYIKEDPDSAIMYIDIALKKAASVGLSNFRGGDLTRMGMVHEALYDLNSAEKYYLEAITESKIQKNHRDRARAYYQLAKLKQMTGDTAQALENALNSYEVAISTRDLTIISSAGLMLSSLYDQLNETDKAYYYLRQSQAASEVLQNEDQVRRASDLQFTEQLRLRDLEEAQERNQARLRMTVLIGVVFTIAVVAFLLFRNNRQKQKANTVLQEQKQKVESTLHELKSTQAQLIQSEKMASLGELTVGIAHEIQNPLNFVNNFSEVNKDLLVELKDEIKNGNFKEVEAIADDVISNEEKINHHGKRADAIVKGMLQHSRTSSGQKKPTDINALCDEYLRLAYHGMKAKDKGFEASFHFEPDNSLPKVNVIPQDIGRVLLNLISNAFYAVNDKSKVIEPNYKPGVVVSTINEGDFVKIKVLDNGSGIPESIKEKVFQPFFTTKPTGQGTGLGLSLSYDIVKAHGGELNVETKEGEGSIFTILLPVI